MDPRRVVLCAAVMLSLLGCRPAAPAAPSGPSALSASAVAVETQPAAIDPELRYSCGTYPFTPDLLDEPASADAGPHPSAATLREFLATPNVDASFLPDTGWWLVGGDADDAEYVAAVPGDPAFVSVGLELTTNGWRVIGWGQCRPSLVLDGLGPATWMLDPTGGPLTSETRAFDALVTELACASGRSSEGRVAPPLIAYRPDELFVAFGVRPLGGEQNCPGNPATQVHVELREPLGNRQLLNAGVFPPHDPTKPWPPP